MSPTDDRAPSFQRTIPSGDDRERSICTRCGFIDYENPRVVVGSVATDDQNRILLCRRAIEPQIGWWTLPAGYLEVQESPQDGAAREAIEEACAEIRVDDLLAVYSIRHTSQVQLFYRARLIDPKRIAPGPESQEVALFAYEDIPWADLAFPTVGSTLKRWREVLGQTVIAPGGNAAAGEVPPTPAP